MKKLSDISGFHRLTIRKRLDIIKKFAGLTNDDIKIISHNSAMGERLADIMIENVVGTTQLPIGIATHFKINGKDYMVPMAIEETSVVAAASHAAKLARKCGGFKAYSDEPIMIGQVQLMDVKNIKKAKRDILSKFSEIKSMVDDKDSTLVKLGGGLKRIDVRDVGSDRGRILVVHLIVDVRDAMGANAVNTYCETIAPYLEEVTGGRSVLKIISNLAVNRIVRVTAVWKKSVIESRIIEGILDAYAFAKADPFRAATHNKGIMNGIDSVLIATSNDWRAAEAGAHAYASITGKYLPLTRYEKNKNGDLIGTIEVPMAVGLIGGATKIHPVAQAMLKILGVKSAQELGKVAAAVGLANNFAALRAMVKEGIRKGHMKLHATNIAAGVGAHGDEIDIVAKRLVQEDDISYRRAHEILNDARIEYAKKRIKKLIRRVRKKVRRGRKGPKIIGG